MGGGGGGGGARPSPRFLSSPTRQREITYSPQAAFLRILPQQERGENYEILWYFRCEFYDAFV